MTTSELHSLCAAPIRWRCIGVELEPLTIGHLEILERMGIKNPQDAGELAAAVFVCAIPWRRWDRLIRSRLTLRLILWLWGKRVREWDFEENLDVFRSYMVHNLRGPNTSRPFGSGEGGGRSNIPLSRYLCCFLCERLNHDPLTVRDYTLRDAIWDHACVREMDGRLVVDDESEDDIADHELPSDELLRVAEEARKAGR